MFEKRFKINLLFNANKVYDRRIIEGIGNYFQSSQCDWDIFLDEDFRFRIQNIKELEGDVIIADYDNPAVVEALLDSKIPVVAVGGSYSDPGEYPDVPYYATDNPPKGPPVLIPPVGVAERQSSDFRALQDPNVIKATHCIRKNACHGVKVSQVVDYVGISRTNLESRFLAEYGHTMHTELHKTKLTHARNLLETTNTSIPEIAKNCGYHSTQYMYTVFRRDLQPLPRSIAAANVMRTSHE